jgi:hypothetical protein
VTREAPPRTARTLRRRVDGQAREDGIATGRVQRWVSYMVLAGALERARDGHGDPRFVVKGGVAMELRLGLVARATKDLDVTLREAQGDMLATLDEALRGSYAGFELTRREPDRVGPTGAVRLGVALSYEGRSWSTVPLELSAAEGMTGYERVAAIDLAPFGLNGPDTVPCLPVPVQIAQKLHACTARRDDGKDNDRFRDLIDIVLLRDLTTQRELPAVRTACVAVFEARGTHPWPPSLDPPASWEAPFGRLAREMDFEPADAAAAASKVRAIVDEIDAAR